MLYRKLTEKINGRHLLPDLPNSINTRMYENVSDMYCTYEVWKRLAMKNWKYYTIFQLNLELAGRYKLCVNRDVYLVEHSGSQGLHKVNIM